MTSRNQTIQIALIASGALVALTVWQFEMFFLATLAIMLSAGIAVAQPGMVATDEGQRLILRGTPVLLLFAVMLGAGAVTTVAADQIAALLNPHLSPLLGGDDAASFECAATLGEVSLN